MPRTETCSACNGAGEANDLLLGDGPCGECGGNGYVPAAGFSDDEIAAVADHAAEHVASKIAENPELYAAIQNLDLTDDTPPPGRMANQTWRILEEQRQAAEDTIRECEHEIDRWLKKKDDAERNKRSCEAGQSVLDGGL